MGVWHTHTNTTTFSSSPLAKEVMLKWRGKIGVKRKKSKTELEEKKEQGQPVEWEKNDKWIFLLFSWYMKSGYEERMLSVPMQKEKVVHRCVKGVRRYLSSFICFLVCFTSPYSFTKHEHLFFAFTTVFLYCQR